MNCYLGAVLLFAAKRRFAQNGLTSGEATLIIGLFVAVLILCGCFELIKIMKNKVKQRQVDQENEKYYRRWRRQLELTNQLMPVASPLLLRRDEECLRVEVGVTLFEVRSVRHSTHTFGSVPLGGSRVRIGGGGTRSESSDEWRPIAQGRLYVTNKQLYFDGDKQDRKIPISKIVTIKADTSAIEVSSDARQKSMVFKGVNGQVVRDIVQLVARDSRGD